MGLDFLNINPWKVSKSAQLKIHGSHDKRAKFKRKLLWALYVYMYSAVLHLLHYIDTFYTLYKKYHPPNNSSDFLMAERISFLTTTQIVSINLKAHSIFLLSLMRSAYRCKFESSSQLTYTLTSRSHDAGPNCKLLHLFSSYLLHLKSLVQFKYFLELK